MANFAEKISRIIDGELEDVEKHCIRPLQVDAFGCCRNCCLDQTSSQERVQECMQYCMKPVAETEKLVTRELENFQVRLNRCGERCGDKARDSKMSAADMQQALEKCIQGCVDEHIDMVPDLMAKIKKNFKTC